MAEYIRIGGLQGPGLYFCWPFLLVTVKIMCKKKCFKCAINVVKAVQVNISNAYMKLQSMN